MSIDAIMENNDLDRDVPMDNDVHAGGNQSINANQCTLVS